MDSKDLRILEAAINSLVQDSVTELTGRINEEISVKDLLAVISTGMKTSQQLRELLEDEEDAPSTSQMKLSPTAQKYLESRRSI